MYERTYADANAERMWASLLVTCDLFRLLGKEVAEAFHFTYPEQDDRNMITYLQHVRELPTDAEMFKLQDNDEANKRK